MSSRKNMFFKSLRPDTKGINEFQDAATPGPSKPAITAPDYVAQIQVLEARVDTLEQQMASMRVSMSQMQRMVAPTPSLYPSAPRGATPGSSLDDW